MAFRLGTPLLFTLSICLPCLAKQPHPATPPPATASAAAPAPAQLPLDDLRVFTKAFENIRTHYVKDISDTKLLEYAMKGMLSELDPHSAYLDSSSLEDLQNHTSGEFGGLGIEVGQEDGLIKVVSPIDDTPASRAGIEAGDLIIKIDDLAVKGISVEDAIEKMRGAKGSKVVLSILRKKQDKPLVMTLVRDIIKVRSVRYEVIDKDYAYIRLSQFQVKTGDDLVAAIAKLQQENHLKGAVLDLRNNPGGVLQASVAVADAFMDGGLVVYTEGRLAQSNEKFYAQPKDLLNGLPLVVLINDGSASASEIVAGALQDAKRAVVMGTRSFGKGSVQTVIPLAETKAMKLTTALYFTPKGRSIQAQGIEPDVVVERAKITALESRGTMSEAELGGHLANGTGAEEVKSDARRKEGEAAKNGLLQKDNQLFEAINLLKGLNILKQG